MPAPIPIGAQIRRVLEDMPKKYTVKWFAAQLNCDRRNVYDIFLRQSIDSELLWRISIILNHDFFKDLSGTLPIYRDYTPFSD